MSATAIGFIFAWLVAAALVSWVCPERWRTIGVASCGAGLLACLSPISLAFLAAGTGVTYLVGRQKERHKLATVLTIVPIVAIYLLILWLSPADSSGVPSFLVPLGMSYYVLRLIHYLVESEKGSFRAHTLADYACYQFLPATIPVGPIHRFDQFLKELRRRRWDPDLVSEGASRVLAGAFKIIVLGNFVLNIELASSFEKLGAGSAALSTYLDTIRYWLNIYLQFGGYSDLAIGFGAIMGFHLPENFNWPFLARNIGQFWRRWHMTLSGWCRDYIYMPVLATWRKPALASSAAMVVLGLWHAVSFHYLIWGLYHATGLIVWRRFDKYTSPLREKLSVPVQNLWHGAACVLTLHFVMFSYPVANALEHLVMRR